MKVLFIILDGIGDRRTPLLNNKSPLEAACTPFLDSLARAGKTGRMIVIDDKTPPETEGAVLAMLGFNPLKYNTGRGALEAVGVGYKQKKGELGIRCNFATVNQAGEVIDTEAERIETKDAKKLVKHLQKNLKLTFHPCKVKLVHTLNYRFLLFIKSEQKLSNKISNTHPGYKKVEGNLEIPVPLKARMKFKPVKALNKTKQARITADLINEFTEKAHKLLANHPINKTRVEKGQHPANAVLMRGVAVEKPKLYSLPKKYKGKWVCIGDTPAEVGISKLAGLDVYNNVFKKIAPPIADELILTKKELLKAMKKDMAARANAVVKSLKKYDFVYAHLKFADPFGHRNQPELKKLSLEYCDKFFLKTLLKKIDLKKTLIALTSDHCTVCVKRSHTADPVPLVLCGGGVKPDKTKQFNEFECKKGALGTFKAQKFLECLFLHLAQ